MSSYLFLFCFFNLVVPTFLSVVCVTVPVFIYFFIFFATWSWSEPRLVCFENLMLFSVSWKISGQEWAVRSLLDYLNMVRWTKLLYVISTFVCLFVWGFLLMFWFCLINCLCIKCDNCITSDLQTIVKINLRKENLHVTAKCDSLDNDNHVWQERCG